jgi:hypothetical protein
MKTLWNCSNYGNDLRLTRKDAKQCSHAGECGGDVSEIMQKDYVRKQLTNLDPAQLKKELDEYGAWDESELLDHSQNLIRWVWISASDITEENLQD